MVLSVIPAVVVAYDPTDPLDGARDSDGDGLSNYNEFLYGTDPSNPDSDGGGATDGWEQAYGLDPANRYDDYTDTDNDGWDNYNEFVHGTDPNNPDTDNDGLKDSVDPDPLVPNPDGENFDGGFANGQGGTDCPVPDACTAGQGSGSGQGTGRGAGRGQGNPTDSDGDGILEEGYTAPMQARYLVLPTISLPALL
jgi:hypothetical protein